MTCRILAGIFSLLTSSPTSALALPWSHAAPFSAPLLPFDNPSMNRDATAPLNVVENPKQAENIADGNRESRRDDVRPTAFRTDSGDAAGTGESIESLAAAAADRVALLFASQSDADYIGEPVSILEHSWQAYLRACDDADASEHVRVASLLHDVGHMLGMEAGYGIGMDGCGVPCHETIGGSFLESLGCHEYVCWLVANHVNAKRFLVWRDPSYELTDASRVTLGFQGGPMTDVEAKTFIERPGYEASIAMRAFDEAAKVPGQPKPSIDDIRAIVYKHVLDTLSSSFGGVSPLQSYHRFLNSSYRLSSEQLRYYDENGYLVIKGHPFLVNSDLADMANGIFSNPTESMLIHHEEVNDASTGEPRVQLCRVENFVRTTTDKWMAIHLLAQDICCELFDEEAVLFKDKLNYKLPGGGGFLAHQDATAYKPNEFALIHISVMVAIDPAKDDDVGPLQFAAGRHKEGVFPHNEGVIAPHEENAMDFQPLYVDEGDIVFFSTYIPHRSFTNMSNRSRRLVYLTYNKKSEGDFNVAYYEAKLATFRDGTGGAISINSDFGGKIVR